MKSALLVPVTSGVHTALRFYEYKPRYLDTYTFRIKLSELGTLRLKSILYAWGKKNHSCIKIWQEKLIIPRSRV
jgi:hypothetical protein